MKKALTMLLALALLLGACALADTQRVAVSGKTTGGAVFSVKDARYVPLLHAVRLNVDIAPADEGVMLIDAQVNPEIDEAAEMFDGALLGVVCDLDGAVSEDGTPVKRSARIKPERDGMGMTYTFIINLDPELHADEAHVSLRFATRETADGENFEERTGEGGVQIAVELEAALAQTSIALDEEVSASFCVSGVKYDAQAGMLWVYVDVNPNDMLSALADLELGTMEKTAEQLRKETLRLGEPVVGIVCDVAEMTDAQGESLYTQFGQSCVRAVRGLAYELGFALTRPLQSETVGLDLILGVSGEMSKDTATVVHLPVEIAIP